ncbi:MAG: tetratricopeptide repeat protein [Bacteroidota bacterium]|nr:tetratricopeptide repeat protein [Bacteroidota bacterium]
MKMSGPWYKNLIIISGVILIIIALSVIPFLWQHKHFADRGANSIENLKISRLLKTLDSTYWENPQQSLDSIDLLIRLSGKMKDNSALAMALYYKAACFIILERYDSAYVLCYNALRFAENQKNELVVGKMKNVLANYYLAKNEFNDANKCLMEALVILEKQGTKKDIANVLNGFGLLYYDLKDPDKAIRYYTRVIGISKEPDKKRQESVAYLNISNCYLAKQDFSLTLYFLNKALTGFHALNDSAFIMMCNMNLGIVAIDQGDKEKGLSYYFKVMEFCKRMKKKVLLGHTLFNIANVYYENNDLVLARKYFVESINVYRSISNKDGEKNVLLELSYIEQRNNNWKQAYAYYDHYINIRDSILNADLLKNINDLQWKYDFQKKENETTVIRKKFELKQRETVILIISFTFFIVVVLLFAALIRLANKNLKKSDKLKELRIIHLQEQMAADEKINRLEKLRLKAEIEAKNKELTTSTMQLIAKNEILTNISGIAESFYKKKAVNDECYVKLKSVLKENLDQERNWENFKRLFEEVHKDFFKSIKQTCPEITENELRLCAYLKINLQNKEIAKILNVTPDSLKTLRYRIRKKFNLNKEIILEEYIRAI